MVPVSFVAAVRRHRPSCQEFNAVRPETRRLATRLTVESGALVGVRTRNRSLGSLREGICQMDDERWPVDRGYVEPMVGIEPMTPAPQPGNMPIQVLSFWTPQLVFRTATQAFKELRAPRRAVQSAAISVRNGDEAR